MIPVDFKRFKAARNAFLNGAGADSWDDKLKDALAAYINHEGTIDDMAMLDVNPQLENFPFAEITIFPK